MLFSVCAILTIDSLASAASVGASWFGWWAIVVVFFFVPYALITAELGGAWPQEGGVYVFSPDGARIAFVPTPGDPTNCVFGGAAEPTTLYVTTQGPPASPRRYGLARIRLKIPGYHVSSPR